LISAKTGQGVSDLFYSLIEMISDKIANTKIVDEIEERKEEEDQTENPSKIQYQKKENK
jgi:hypothetical protein